MCKSLSYYALSPLRAGDRANADAIVAFWSASSSVATSFGANRSTSTVERQRRAHVGGDAREVAFLHRCAAMAWIRMLRRRLRCQFHTGGLHQFNLHSGRCMYCGTSATTPAGRSSEQLGESRRESRFHRLPSKSRS